MFIYKFIARTRKTHKRLNAVLVKCPLIPEGFCLNLFGTLWAKDPSWNDEKIVNHERIHDAQQRELLFIPFYILYIIEWLYRLTIHRDSRKAYYAISFEREAYANGHDLSYLRRRRHYSWTKYLK